MLDAVKAIGIADLYYGFDLSALINENKQNGYVKTLIEKNESFADTRKARLIM